VYDVSEERIASIFRVDKSASEGKRELLANQLLTLFFARRFFCPEDGSDMLLPNVSSYKTHMAPYFRRRHSSKPKFLEGDSRFCA
jgi:hypothetical protein